MSSKRFSAPASWLRRVDQGKAGSSRSRKKRNAVADESTLACFNTNDCGFVGEGRGFPPVLVGSAKSQNHIQMKEKMVKFHAKYEEQVRKRAEALLHERERLEAKRSLFKDRKFPFPLSHVQKTRLQVIRELLAEFATHTKSKTFAFALLRDRIEHSEKKECYTLGKAIFDAMKRAQAGFVQELESEDADSQTTQKLDEKNEQKRIMVKYKNFETICGENEDNIALFIAEVCKGNEGSIGKALKKAEENKKKLIRGALSTTTLKNVKLGDASYIR